jgi:hypothetical protein
LRSPHHYHQPLSPPRAQTRTRSFATTKQQPQITAMAVIVNNNNNAVVVVLPTDGTGKI